MADQLLSVFRSTVRKKSQLVYDAWGLKSIIRFYLQTNIKITNDDNDQVFDADYSFFEYQNKHENK